MQLKTFSTFYKVFAKRKKENNGEWRLGREKVGDSSPQ
jgi:hypothetical protein